MRQNPAHLRQANKQLERGRLLSYMYMATRGHQRLRFEQAIVTGCKDGGDSYLGLEFTAKGFFFFGRTSLVGL